jgi:transcriptional regulator with XRE-family HTH domain
MVGKISEFAACFGKVLRRLRKRGQLTQEQLGFESGLERNFISMLELGQRQPSLHTLFKLSTALGITAEVFVREINTELQISQNKPHGK